MVKVVHWKEASHFAYTACSRKDTGKPNILTTVDKYKATCKQCKKIIYNNY